MLLPEPPQPRLDDTIEGAIATSLGEQVGGGRRPPSPLLETPTRLRTRVKPSEKARDNAVVQQAELRRARMGDITGSASSSTNTGSGSPPPAIF
ncbi:hypothetical protein EV363DRAFT_1191641 [Boletus edulis]|nr:hypothetical protein EV363DRAFT_1191641 [Boletus edulis]